MRADTQTDRKTDRHDEAKPIFAIQRTRLKIAVGAVHDGVCGHTYRVLIAMHRIYRTSMILLQKASEVK